LAHEHHFAATLTWTGAARGPTTDYESYSREYLIEIPGKPPLKGSAAAEFRGDAGLCNPEDWLVAALSACHCLSYLAVCARARLQVVGYQDSATGTMAMKDGKMRFTEVVLRPIVTVAPGADRDKAMHCHEMAHAQCFIANSVNFPVRHEAKLRFAENAGRA
jgi:organic hydroperoxide reductase OsmC/OhrA